MSATRNDTFERTVIAEDGGQIRTTLAHHRLYVAVRPAGARVWTTLPVALDAAGDLGANVTEQTQLGRALRDRVV